MANAVGVIDSGYRGEVIMKFKPSIALDRRQCATEKLVYKIYDIGERIAQMIIMPYPHIEFEEVDELSKTEKDSGGYGALEFN